jgi:hypothetical protein
MVVFERSTVHFQVCSGKRLEKSRLRLGGNTTELANVLEEARQSEGISPDLLEC